MMEPSGNLASNFGLPRLVGPYVISAITLFLATLVIQFFLRPDPFLLAQERNISSQIAKKSTKHALAHIRTNERALFAIAAIAIGHVAMVSIMVMTPVHMAHVDVTLTIIGLVISVHVLGMYAFSPIVGSLSDRIGRIRTIQIGVLILLLSALISGFAMADDAITLG
ncbi:MAG: MFS transporter, partial [Actinomycetales bacterium]